MNYSRLLPRFLLPAIARLLLAISCATVGFGANSDDVKIIVHPDNPNAVNQAFVSRVYLGTERGWPDGSPVFALDQPEDSPARQIFCASVLGKTVANVRAVWSQNIFTGKGMPPRVAGADAEMKRLVSTNRNAIGYIRASEVDGSVKVVE